MKVIHTDEIIAAVERLCVEANYFLGEDVLKALIDVEQMRKVYWERIPLRG